MYPLQFMLSRPYKWEDKCACLKSWGKDASNMGNCPFRSGVTKRNRQPRRWFPAEYRVRAATLYAESGYNAKAAGEKLVSSTNGKVPKRPGEFCRAQYIKEQKHGSVKDRPIRGRPRKVPSALAKQIADEFILPDDSDGEPVYRENAEHVLDLNPALKRQVAQLGCHARTVTRAVKRILDGNNGDIEFRSVKRERRLTTHEKEARMRFAAKMRRCSKGQLHATVFVDESWFSLQPSGNIKVAVKKGASPRPSTDSAKKKRSQVKLHYLGAVMHGVGYNAFVITTGTTWLPRNYKVCSRPSWSTLNTTLSLPKERDQVKLHPLTLGKPANRSLHCLASCNTSKISCSLMFKSLPCILNMCQPCSSAAELHRSSTSL
jgi:hypothetical protein